MLAAFFRTSAAYMAAGIRVVGLDEVSEPDNVSPRRR
jgi:hypothetical protein